MERDDSSLKGLKLMVKLNDQTVQQVNLKAALDKPLAKKGPDRNSGPRPGFLGRNPHPRTLNTSL